ncbi:coiled-coil domain-containing protein 142 [Melanerpes formicivorus]|uniref:coiled-coil domain-containing protein 142 n=1 Tax=Melanerpes formicivorus TaxID=211600 RepID=UPI00358E973B
MEDGGPERRGGETCMKVDDGDGAGLSGLLLLLLQPPGDGAARGDSPETGGSSLGGLARSLQRAEAMLRSCVTPSLRRLLPPRARQRSNDGSEDEDEEEAPAFVAPLEHSFPGLRRCLCIWEDPRTETFHGHVRHQPGDVGATAFTYHPVHPRVAERGAALHALLQHRHLLRLARDYSRRLKATSDFLRRLMALPEPLAGEPGAKQSLRELCQELRTHAGHWSGLRQRIAGDPWLRPLLLRRHESVAHMRRALVLPALAAAGLAERHIEAQLRALARAGTVVALPSPALLSDLFQGIEIYNRVMGDLALEMGTAGSCGAAGDPSCTFPAAKVLEILAAERGQLAAKRLQPLLQPRDVAEHTCWEDLVVPWPAERGAVAGMETSRLGFTRELQELCREDEELMGHVLGVLVASTNTLWYHVLHGPNQEKPLTPSPRLPEPVGMDAGSRPSSAGWKSVRWLDASWAPAAEALHTRYRRLLWGATGTALGHWLGLPHCPTGSSVATAREMSQALARAGVPQECEEELGWLCLRLLCQGVLQSWDSDFCHALGSALSDPCSGEPGPVPAAGPVRSRTGWCLQRLYPGLTLALHCLQILPGHPSGQSCPRLQVLSRCVATAQASCWWLMSRACRYLSAWALPQFLIVTQGDLQLLKTETDKLVLLVRETFPVPGDTHPGLSPNTLDPPLTSPSPWELQLCQQLHSVATSIQLFSGDVLKMFSTDCKRMSAEIFDQTMPLGKHWRVGLRPDLPSSPSAYAAAAAQAVLGQVLQGAQLLPRDAQAPALARVTTAFLEAWMDHILAQRIKFSLQGALQLRQDFELVRELVASERYGLAPETRQALLALRVFQQMDGAILCLLQQPGGAAGGAPRPWHNLRRCCSDEGAHPQEPGTDALHGLDTLEAAPVPPQVGPPPSDAGVRLRSGVPESYLSGSQQQWLSLRLNRARRWRVPGLPCVGNNPET